MKLLFGRRMFFENAGTNRGAMLSFMIGTNWSFAFISSRRESTHAFSSALPCLMPIPYGACEEHVVGDLRGAIGGRDRIEHRVVEHDRVGAALVEGEHGVRDVSATITCVLLKHLFIHRS